MAARKSKAKDDDMRRVIATVLVLAFIAGVIQLLVK